MALAATLNTNEVKDSAGAGITFTRWATGPGRYLEYAYSGETPSKPNRLKISHAESGTGLSRRRRSVISFERTDTGQVDATQFVKNRNYFVGDYQVGNMTSTAYMKELMANLISFMASLGASTTILYDGTGNGAATSLAGSV
jgi:hypothetical protein